MKDFSKKSEFEQAKISGNASDMQGLAHAGIASALSNNSFLLLKDLRKTSKKLETNQNPKTIQELQTNQKSKDSQNTDKKNPDPIKKPQPTSPNIYDPFPNITDHIPNEPNIYHLFPNIIDHIPNEPHFMQFLYEEITEEEKIIKNPFQIKQIFNLNYLQNNKENNTSPQETEKSQEINLHHLTTHSSQELDYISAIQASSSPASLDDKKAFHPPAPKNKQENAEISHRKVAPKENTKPKKKKSPLNKQKWQEVKRNSLVSAETIEKKQSAPKVSPNTSKPPHPVSPPESIALIDGGRFAILQDNKTPSCLPASVAPEEAHPSGKTNAEEGGQTLAKTAKGDGESSDATKALQSKDKQVEGSKETSVSVKNSSIEDTSDSAKDTQDSAEKNKIQLKKTQDSIKKILDLLTDKHLKNHKEDEEIKRFLNTSNSKDLKTSKNNLILALFDETIKKIIEDDTGKFDDRKISLLKSKISEKDKKSEETELRCVFSADAMNHIIETEELSPIIEEVLERANIPKEKDSNSLIIFNTDGINKDTNKSYVNLINKKIKKKEKEEKEQKCLDILELLAAKSFYNYQKFTKTKKVVDKLSLDELRKEIVEFKRKGLQSIMLEPLPNKCESTQLTINEYQTLFNKCPNLSDEEEIRLFIKEKPLYFYEKLIISNAILIEKIPNKITTKVVLFQSEKDAIINEDNTPYCLYLEKIINEKKEREEKDIPRLEKHAKYVSNILENYSPEDLEKSLKEIGFHRFHDRQVMENPLHKDIKHTEQLNSFPNQNKDVVAIPIHANQILKNLKDMFILYYSLKNYANQVDQSVLNDFKSDLNNHRGFLKDLYFIALKYTPNENDKFIDIDKIISQSQHKKIKNEKKYKKATIKFNETNDKTKEIIKDISRISEGKDNISKLTEFVKNSNEECHRKYIKLFEDLQNFIDFFAKTTSLLSKKPSKESSLTDTLESAKTQDKKEQADQTHSSSFTARREAEKSKSRGDRRR